MKIYWDNLEKLRYRPDRDQWQHKKYKNTFYIYKKKCKECGEQYLTRVDKISDFCGLSCSNKRENNGFYGKTHTYEFKKLISRNQKGKKNNLWKGGVIKKNLPLYDTYAEQIMYAEPVRRSSKDKNILEVKCTYCGKWYVPKRTEIRARINALNGKYGYNTEYRLYCSNECKQECPIYGQVKYPKGYKKTSYREVQPELRQLVFERDNWECQKCGNTKSLHCHHVEGIRWDPLESADIDKCITLCKKCHKEVHKKEDCRTIDMRCKGV